MSYFENLSFSPYFITDLFIIHNGSGAPKKDVGAVPYVAASFQNNGIVGYVDTHKYPGGWLSLVKDGDGGAGTCFFQPGPFWPSNHVLALEPKTKGLTESALLCIATIITHQCFPKYSRGNAINATRLSRQKIMVPVTTDDNGMQIVDWKGMELLGEELLTNANRHVRIIRDELLATDVSDFVVKDYMPMFITDLFIIHNGIGTPKKDVGAVPYVAASFQNNGIVGYVDTHKYPGGWLSLVKDGDGGAGTCFFQPGPFWPSNHVLALEPKSKGLTESALLCIATIITHQCFPKYSRGNAINATRLSRQKIMVPVTTDDNGMQIVDWKIMELMGDKLKNKIGKALSVNY